MSEAIVDWGNKTYINTMNTQHKKRTLYFNEGQLLGALMMDKKNIQYASDKLLDNKQVMLKAIKLGISIEYLSEQLCNDKDIVMQAVKQNSTQIRYASERLQNDIDIVVKAMEKDDEAKYYTSVFRNKDSVLKLLKRKPQLFKYTYAYTLDRQVVLEAVRLDGMNLRHVAEKWIEMTSDLQVILEAVKQNGASIQYASNELKNNKQVILTALEGPMPVALCYIDEKWKRDKEIIIQACKHVPTINCILSMIPEEFVIQEKAFFIGLELGKSRTITKLCPSYACSYYNVLVWTSQ
jgi:hypothetical protein